MRKPIDFHSLMTLGHRRFLILVGALLYIPLTIVLHAPASLAPTLPFLSYGLEILLLFALWGATFIPALVAHDGLVLSIALTSSAIQSLLTVSLSGFDPAYAFGGYLVTFGTMLIFSATTRLTMLASSLAISLANFSLLFSSAPEGFPTLSYVMGLQLLLLWSLFTGFNRLSLLEELGDMRTALIQKSHTALLGTIAAGLAHELNNPLAIVHMALQVLSENKFFRDATSAEVLNKAIKGITRATGITQSLRVLGDEKAFRRKDHALPLASAIDLIESQYRDRLRLAEVQIKLTGASSHSLLPLQAVAQVLFPMISNALDAYEDSERSPAQRIIEIQISENLRGSNQIHIDISDWGCGLPENQDSRVFDPFFTNKKPGKGAGLGLTLARAAAEAAQGTLRVTSTRNPTRFRLTLPTASKMSDKKRGKKRTRFQPIAVPQPISQAEPEPRVPVNTP